MKNIVKFMILLLICQRAFASTPTPNLGTSQQDATQLLREAALARIQRNQPNPPNASSISAAQEQRATCGMPYTHDEDEEIKDIIQLECKHSFCKECLMGIIDSAIASKDSSSLMCPTDGCTKTDPTAAPSERIIRTKITKADLCKILGDDDVNKNKILGIIEQNRLDRDPATKQCPTPDCPKTFPNKDNEAFSVTCEGCKKTYCASCLEDHPANETCQKAAARIKVSKENEDTEKWAQENTRPCPKCKTRIEKNEGCSHITCRKCRYEFCWNCAAPFINKPTRPGGPKPPNHPSFCRIPEEEAKLLRQERTGESHAVVEPPQAHIGHYDRRELYRLLDAMEQLHDRLFGPHRADGQGGPLHNLRNIWGNRFDNPPLALDPEQGEQDDLQFETRMIDDVHRRIAEREAHGQKNARILEQERLAARQAKKEISKRARKAYQLEQARLDTLEHERKLEEEHQKRVYEQLIHAQAQQQPRGGQANLSGIIQALSKAENKFRLLAIDDDFELHFNMQETIFNQAIGLLQEAINLADLCPDRISLQKSDVKEILDDIETHIMRFFQECEDYEYSLMYERKPVPPQISSFHKSAMTVWLNIKTQYEKIFSIAKPETAKGQQQTEAAHTSESKEEQETHEQEKIEKSLQEQLKRSQMITRQLQRESASSCPNSAESLLDRLKELNQDLYVKVLDGRLELSPRSQYSFNIAMQNFSQSEEARRGTIGIENFFERILLEAKQADQRLLTKQKHQAQLEPHDANALQGAPSSSSSAAAAPPAVQHNQAAAPYNQPLGADLHANITDIVRALNKADNKSRSLTVDGDEFEIYFETQRTTFNQAIEFLQTAIGLAHSCADHTALQGNNQIKEVLDSIETHMERFLEECQEYLVVTPSEKIDSFHTHAADTWLNIKTQYEKAFSTAKH